MSSENEDSLEKLFLDPAGDEGPSAPTAVEEALIDEAAKRLAHGDA
jgi:hypothetical protein